MDRRWLLAAAAIPALAASAALAQTEIVADPAFPCDNDFCQSYNQPATPFKIFGDTWYVGTTRLSTLLITSDEGHILVDGGFPGAAPVIAENIRALGFDPADIKLIVNSHTHVDHAGSLGAFQQATGAGVAASPAAAAALEIGGSTPDDPQYREGAGPSFTPLTDVRRVQDGESLTVGGNTITAVFTPGHTPGGTTWTWHECEGETCRTIVYADSLNPISSDTYRYSDNAQYLDAFRNSMAIVATLPCDIVVVPHPELVDLWDKQALINEDGDNPFIDPLGCARYALGFAELLGARLAAEVAAAPPASPN